VGSPTFAGMFHLALNALQQAGVQGERGLQQAVEAGDLTEAGKLEEDAMHIFAYGLVAGQ